MRLVREFVTNAVVGGVLVILPVYLALLLLLKGMKVAARMKQPTL